MENHNILITGGYGCIGAETTKWLVEHSDANVVVCSRSVSPQRNERVFDGVDPSRIRFVKADVSHFEDVARLLSEHQISHIVHLAALQTPDCNEHRDLGLQINLAGTQNLIEAVKKSGRQLRRFIFASSIAVYGLRTSYKQDRVPMLAATRPVNVYGVWKIAGEHLTRLFHEETGTPAISLRPGVLFGPGRDAGLTSSPTTAMKCVSLGRPYEIPFRSRQDYLFAPDVGAAFGNALLNPFEGYRAFTLPSHTADTFRFVDAMKKAAIELGMGDVFQITVGDQDVPFICDLEYEPFCEAFPATPHTDLSDGIRKSLAVFRERVERGWLTADDL